MSAEEEKAEVKELFARFNLVENRGYVRPRKSLSQDDFILLKKKFSELGYEYQQGKGFVKGKYTQVK